MTRWRIWYDDNWQLWMAMPWDRMWYFAWGLPWTDGPVVGPIGMRWFQTWQEAMDYAHDPRQAFLDGWQP